MPAKYQKRKKGKRRYSLRRVRTTPLVALSTLGSTIAISQGTVGVTTDTYRIISTKLAWSLVGLTAGEGPISFGFAHSDYNVTEIKECLEASAIDKGDKLAMEKSNRLVRLVGTFNDKGMYNDGNPKSTRLNWLINIGDQVNIFAYNEAAAALTTGSSLHAVGDLWIKDSV